jgi:hypothetical protein
MAVNKGKSFYDAGYDAAMALKQPQIPAIFAIMSRRHLDATTLAMDSVVTIAG